MKAHNTLPRHIALAGSYNLRDVGGYSTRDQRRTRWRTLFRSASLHYLEPESWISLREQGVRTIIDLRRPTETNNDSYLVDEQLGIRYQHIPLFDDVQYEQVDQPARDLDQLYRLLLDHCSAQFATVLRVIGAQESGPSLVHCAIGKDRTGLVIALSLGIAGVDYTTIADDYAQSGPLLKPILDQFRAYEQANGGDMERLDAMLHSDHNTMLRTLEYIDNNYGSVSGYLARAGMSDNELAQLHATLVE